MQGKYLTHCSISETPVKDPIVSSQVVHYDFVKRLQDNSARLDTRVDWLLQFSPATRGAGTEDAAPATLEN